MKKMQDGKKKKKERQNHAQAKVNHKPYSVIQSIPQQIKQTLGTCSKDHLK
jgi:hypothetical protein